MSPTTGLVFVNADDWGRDSRTTDMIAGCARLGSVTAVSAMVFMEDSERAAAIARERDVDAGLHLNFTTPFTGPAVSSSLHTHQQRLIRYLRSFRFAQVVFHPGLIDSFEYVTKTQFDEFERLFGAAAVRVDGHHHMHLCANMLWQRLLPTGLMTRRSFTFRSDEKGTANRLYRASVDRLLSFRHSVPDCLFSIQPLDPARLRSILAISDQRIVELETHPSNLDEFEFLSSGGIFRYIDRSSVVSARTAKAHLQQRVRKSGAQ